MKKQHTEGRIFWYSSFEETVLYAWEKLRWKYQQDFGNLKSLTGKEKDECLSVSIKCSFSTFCFFNFNIFISIKIQYLEL